MNRFTDTARSASRKVSGEPVYTQAEVETLLRTILLRLAMDSNAKPADAVRDAFAGLGVTP